MLHDAIHKLRDDYKANPDFFIFEGICFEQPRRGVCLLRWGFAVHGSVWWRMCVSRARARVAAVCARVALAEVSICKIHGMFGSGLAAGFPNSG
jgi:hypothetical protein